MEGGVFQEMYLAEAIYERCRKKDRIKTTELVARQEKNENIFVKFSRKFFHLLNITFFSRSFFCSPTMWRTHQIFSSKTDKDVSIFCLLVLTFIGLSSESRKKEDFLLFEESICCNPPYLLSSPNSIG